MAVMLRPYQSTAVGSIFAYFERAKGNPLCVLPTGSGKSLVLAAFIRRAIETYPETRVLVVTHRAELIEQDARAIRSFWPEANVGIYSAGLGMRQVRPITVAGVQSIVNVEDMRAPDLIIVDEAHLIPKDGEGQYRTLLARFPDARVIGLTATPYRLNGGRLTRGEGKIFSSICYELPVQQLVDEGYLSPLISPPARTARSFSTSGVTTRAGDFAIGELAKKVEGQDDITLAALTEAAALAADRSSWLVYCVSVEHARQAAEHLFSLGVSARVVTGDTDPGARKSAIEQFKAKQYKALVTVDIFTTGFDAPNVDCIVLLRPTQSTGLYVQICGRGMRLSPGKANCLVLDYGENIERHGPITAVKPKESKADGKAKEKVCGNCDAEIAAWKRECPECGFIFPRVEREIDHAKQAASLAVMGPPPPPEWIEVSTTSYQRWEKRAAEGQPPPPPTVCVTYNTGNLAKRDHREWVCPEHGGFAAQKFCRWWLQHGGLKPYPLSVSEALERESELRRVEAIVVEKDGRYERIKQVRFAPDREPGSDDVNDDDKEQESGYAVEPEFVDVDQLPF